MNPSLLTYAQAVEVLKPMKVSVFVLCGHGSTLEKAAKMAGVKVEKEEAV